MNLNLILDSDQNNAPQNYENVLINDIDKIPPSICKNLLINNTLNYLTSDQFNLLLQKVRHGGVVSINSPDAMEMARALYWGEIDLHKLSSLTANNKTQHSLLEIKNIFEQSGYIIESASINNLSFYIEVKRP